MNTLCRHSWPAFVFKLITSLPNANLDNLGWQTEWEVFLVWSPPCLLENQTIFLWVEGVGGRGRDKKLEATAGAGIPVYQKSEPPKVVCSALCSPI